MRHNIIQWWLNGLGEFFFPSVCRFCNEVGPADSQCICSACWECLEPAPRDSDYGIMERTDLDDIRFAFTYSGFLQHLIHSLKYDHLTAIVTRLAASMKCVWPDESVWNEASCIVPVPLHCRKQRERGFNQTELIAAELSRLVGCPMNKHMLMRRVNNASQTIMSGPEERKKNVTDIFEFNLKFSIAGQSIIILDDVITTGATINSCARLLKKNGAARVLGFGIGRPIFTQ